MHPRNIKGLARIIGQVLVVFLQDLVKAHKINVDVLFQSKKIVCNIIGIVFSASTIFWRTCVTFSTVNFSTLVNSESIIFKKANGWAEGSFDGINNGALDGCAEGSEDGATEGSNEGSDDGFEDGSADGGVLLEGSLEG